MWGGVRNSVIFLIWCDKMVTRKFGGLVYQLSVYYKKKSDAVRAAKRFRKQRNENARVVESYGQWSVYTRKR